MQSILAGLFIFNAFFSSSNYQFDTFEIAQNNFSKNKKTLQKYSGQFDEINALSFGSRKYDQASSWFRYGQATYIYGQSSSLKNNKRELKQYGGYIGLFGEFNYKRYLGLGLIAGGGATFTEYNDEQLKRRNRSNYFGLASPYITLGYPLTKTASINLTASTYFLSSPSEQINGVGEGFEPPHNLDNKFGLEFVWSWN